MYHNATLYLQRCNVDIQSVFSHKANIQIVSFSFVLLVLVQPRQWAPLPQTDQTTIMNRIHFLSFHPVSTLGRKIIRNS